jgi:hypothetical protein
VPKEAAARIITLGNFLSKPNPVARLIADYLNMADTAIVAEIESIDTYCTWMGAAKWF